MSTSLDRPYTVEYNNGRGESHSVTVLANTAWDAQLKVACARTKAVNITSVRATDEVGL